MRKLVQYLADFCPTNARDFRKPFFDQFGPRSKPMLKHSLLDAVIDFVV